MAHALRRQGRHAGRPADRHRRARHRQDDDLEQWELQPPLQLPRHYRQLEVPSLVHRPGRYYLFVSTQNRPEETDNAAKQAAFRGYVAPSLLGPWEFVYGETDLIYGHKIYAPLVFKRGQGSGKYAAVAFFSEDTTLPITATPLIDIEWEMDEHLGWERPVFDFEGGRTVLLKVPLYVLDYLAAQNQPFVLWFPPHKGPHLLCQSEGYCRRKHRDTWPLRVSSLYRLSRELSVSCIRGLRRQGRRRSVGRRPLCVRCHHMAKKSKWKGRTRKNPTRTIRVESGTVYVVPFPFARSYFGFEIEDEGFHRSDCHPVVLLPRHEAGPGHQGVGRDDLRRDGRGPQDPPEGGP